MVEKRTIKISVAVMAIAALVMGLAIGLGQKNKNEKTSSASSLSQYQRQCDTGIATVPSGGAKAGKAPVAPKAEKSPTAAKAEKTVDRRELIVPGTEDAAVALGSGKRRMMKEELLRGKCCFCSTALFHSFCLFLLGWMDDGDMMTIIRAFNLCRSFRVMDCNVISLDW
jgi:hypothetical protein